MLIDWKRGNQNSYGGTALQGLAISRVSAGLPDSSGAWWHDPLAGVNELQRGATLGSTGWEHGREYQFDLHFYSNNIQVWVDGTKEIDISGSFSDGRFGFYNYSQASVRYAGITEDQLPPVNPIPEPATWAMTIAGFGLVGVAARRRRTVSA